MFRTQLKTGGSITADVENILGTLFSIHEKLYLFPKVVLDPQVALPEYLLTYMKCLVLC
jgi:hypothetical protein